MCTHAFLYTLETSAEILLEDKSIRDAFRSLLCGPTLIYHPLGTARARNPAVTTEVLGNISRRKKGEESNVPNYYALCTLDGTLTLIDNDNILWSLYVDHQLFTLSKLDVTVSHSPDVRTKQQTHLRTKLSVLRLHNRKNFLRREMARKK